MQRHIKITFLEDEENGPWQDSIPRIIAALRKAADAHINEFTLEIEQLRLVSVKQGMLYTPSEGVHCVVCHPTEHVLSALTNLPSNTQWILVSGGERPTESSALAQIRSSELIWFEGVYGREHQFETWLIEWASHGFSSESFSATYDALLTGRRGIGSVALRLIQNLVPVTMILDAFLGALEKLQDHEGKKFTNDEHYDSKCQEVQKWLCDSLSNLWYGEKIFTELSKDATLLHGAIKNSKSKLTVELLDLKDILSYFLPTPGFHGDDYDPELDESIRAIVKGRESWESTIKTVMLWHQRLSNLCSLLEAVPDNL